MMAYMKQFFIAIFNTEKVEKNNCKGIFTFDGVEMGSNEP